MNSTESNNQPSQIPTLTFVETTGSLLLSPSKIPISRRRFLQVSAAAAGILGGFGYEEVRAQAERYTAKAIHQRFVEIMLPVLSSQEGENFHEIENTYQTTEMPIVSENEVIFGELTRKNTIKIVYTDPSDSEHTLSKVLYFPDTAVELENGYSIPNPLPIASSSENGFEDVVPFKIYDEQSFPEAWQTYRVSNVETMQAAVEIAQVSSFFSGFDDGIFGFVYTTRLASDNSSVLVGSSLITSSDAISSSRLSNDEIRDLQTKIDQANQPKFYSPPIAENPWRFALYAV